MNYPLSLPFSGCTSPAGSLEAITRQLLVHGKGILAVDESLGTLGKRFFPLAIPCTAETRQAYRELLMTAPALEECISGVILFDETIRQQALGMPMPQLLAQKGILPGIKVDLGTAALPGFVGEKFTQGLDGLRERLSEYRQLGARFTKWRAVICVGKKLPSSTCVQINAHALALFASLSQEAGLVPMVEPEVLMEGNHTIGRCEEVTTLVLKAVFQALLDQRVLLESMILKTGMILPGNGCLETASPSSVADATMRCFSRVVPAAVPGIAFLSGGQTELEATERLNEICKREPSPWTRTFSFGRALQDEALKMWRGKPANREAAQAALLGRARYNSLALQGRCDTSVGVNNPVETV